MDLYLSLVQGQPLGPAPGRELLAAVAGLDGASLAVLAWLQPDPTSGINNLFTRLLQIGTTVGVVVAAFS